MNLREVTTFAKRLNVVLAAAGWPECEYVGGPDLQAIGKPYSTVTIYGGEEDHIRLAIRRSDAGQVAYVEAYLQPHHPRPAMQARNDLIRRTRMALA